MAWLPDEPMIYDKLSPLEYLEFVAGLWGVERSGPSATLRSCWRFSSLPTTVMCAARASRAA